MKRLGCFFGSHKFELVAVNRDYHTTFVDTKKTEYHIMRFYQCSCGQRKFKTDYPYKYSTHTGIDLAKENWLDVGVVPSSSYDPRNVQNNYTPTPPKPTAKPIIDRSPKVIPFKVIKGGTDE